MRSSGKIADMPDAELEKTGKLGRKKEQDGKQAGRTAQLKNFYSITTLSEPHQTAVFSPSAIRVKNPSSPSVITAPSGANRETYNP